MVVLPPIHACSTAHITNSCVVGAGKYDNADKDRIEEEVGLVVKVCTQKIEQLKNSVTAAQQVQPATGRPAVNEQTAVHLHGVVS